MRYVCRGCGKVLTEAETILDPDDDYICDSCYIDNKADYFPDEVKEDPQVLKPTMVKALTGAVDTKKSFWSRRR